MRLEAVLAGFVFAAVAILMNKPAAHQTPQTTAPLAATPPMGWNSWDAYGETVSEADIRANAQWMAEHLKKFGWQYIVVDSGWYVTNHSAGTNAANAEFSLDAFGRYTPAVNTIPSAAGGGGFKPLGDFLHSLGLKFGLHILRGIPKEAVQRNLPIAGSSFRAADAANTSDTCPWNPFNYGLDASKPAAQAYYDSLAEQFDDWGVDFLKVDCIADHPYKGDEIRMISQARRKARRPIVLSLSPGPTALDKAQEVSKYAQMWRISDDMWDLWYSETQFPSGVKNQFARAAKWAPFAGPGHWPDTDMLPIGRLEPAAGWGQPRATRLTHDEQRTMLTLWAIARSPLIMGGNLTLCDEWTESLLTNPEVIAVNQSSIENRAVLTTDKFAVWTARSKSSDDLYLAAFNLDNDVQTLPVPWVLICPDCKNNDTAYLGRDLWERADLGLMSYPRGVLAPHASALFKLTPVTK
ncbi:MAG TPA: glycoside hydrolase family 27 protein [Candidatus Acidoferrum sp.]|nr:glycoside hydrolase family 27 protein [Candidatus Acidoferrum sp.]